MSVAVPSSSQPPTPTGTRPTSAGASQPERTTKTEEDGTRSADDGDATLGTHATTSRVTLEEFKKQKQQTLATGKEDLLKSHEHNIRMLCYMILRDNRFDLEGSPSMPPSDDHFDLLPDEYEMFQTMLKRFSLTGKDRESIAELGMPTLDEARELILRNITATRKLILPQRPRPDLSAAGSLASVGRSHSQSMLPPATTPLRADVTNEKPRKTSAGSASKATAMLPRLPLTDVPMMPTAAQMLPIAPQTTLPLPPPPAISILPDQPPVQALQLQAQTQALKEASQGSSSALTDVAATRLDSQSGNSQSALLTAPSSQATTAEGRAAGTVNPANIVDSSVSPLHPTLQALAPNPLSVTYASSLRPLPQDPFRRYTGIGIGGGAVHHRGHRRAPQLPSKNGVPPPAGPAGAGGVDLFQWAVRARASPGAGLVGKADKCLLTTDWKVAFTEQRFIRTMNRIEKLKSEGKWSFRQPKKQRGPAVRKAHWDHVLEEMRWLQTDFKQERRWKITVAYQLALAAREFVRAKTPQARARLTIKTRPIRYLEAMEVDEKAAEISPSSESKEEQRDHVDEDTEMTAEGDEDDAAVEDDADDVEEDADADADGEEDAPGEDDVDAEGEDDDGEVEAVTGLHVDKEEVKPGQDALPSGPANEQGVAQASGGAAAEAATEVANNGVASKDVVDVSGQWPMNVISNVRAPIFAMDVIATTVSPKSLLEQVDSNALAEMLGINPYELGQRFDLDQLTMSMLFPELPLFEAPSAPTDSKAERRWDDGSLNQPPRLTHVSRLMDSKPVLVSTLQPAKNRQQSHWRSDGEWNIAAELADPTKGVPAELADAPPAPGSMLFTRKSNKPSRDVNHTSANAPLPQAPTNAAARSSQFIWTTDEDNFLLSLIRQYGQHWQLISNLFNAARLSVPTDVREAWDCYDRYQKIQQAAAEGKPPPGPTFTALDVENGSGGKSSTGTSTPQQGNSLHLKQEKLTKKLGAKYDGSRKKLRRYNITEVMKKCAKRRAEILQRNVNHSKQVNLQSHETHNQVKPGVTPTPQQLSMLKAERDEAHARQFALMQQQHRQAQAQAQAQAAAAAAAQQQQQGQSNSGQQAAATSAATQNAATPKPQPAQAQGQGQGQGAGTANAQQNLQAQQQQHQHQLQAQQQRLLQQLAAQQQQQQQGGTNGQQLTQQQQQQQQRFAAAAAAAQQASAATGQQQPQSAASQQLARTGSATGNAASPAPATSGAPAARGPTPTQVRPAAPNATQSAGAAPAQGIPPQLAALQATLTQSLANNPSFSPEQINTIALQLYRQAQQQGGLGNINLGNAQNRQAQANAATANNVGAAARPVQQQQGTQPRPVVGATNQVRPPSSSTSSPVTQSANKNVRPPNPSPQKQGAGGSDAVKANNAVGQVSAGTAKGKKGQN